MSYLCAKQAEGDLRQGGAEDILISEEAQNPKVYILLEIYYYPKKGKMGEKNEI